VVILGIISAAAAAVPVVAWVVKTKQEREHEEKLGKTHGKVAAEQTRQAELAAQIAAQEAETMMTVAAYGAAAFVIVGALSLAVYTKGRKEQRG
jgi:hypothetical protein